MSMTKSENSQLQAFVGEAKEKKEQYDKLKINVALIGESGSGKSSLINAIVGSTVAKTGSTRETTQKAQPVEYHGLVFWDLPGCGTIKHPRETYIEKQGLLENYDIFVLVTRMRIREGDTWLYEKLCTEKNKTVFVVRTGFDQDVQDLDELTARHEINEDIREQLSAGFDFTPYIVALKGENTFDLGKLVDGIIRALSGEKRKKTVMAVAVHNEGILREKRKSAEDLVGWYALLAAGNAINPIPGLDISVDITVLLKMSAEIVSAYGLREDQLNYTAGHMKTTVGVLKIIASPVARYLATEGAILLLNKFAVSISAKAVAKWFPIIGSVISALLGYQLASYYGMQIVNDCEKAAREILDKGLPNAQES